jgi:DNA-binding MarR family transcriptional regulator
VFKHHYQVSTYQNSVGYLIKRAHSLMLNDIEPVLMARGFTYVQYFILSWLRDGMPVNAKDICTQFRHDSGALTRVIDQLAERGLLERVRRDRDRRKVDLQLTPTGLETIQGLVALIVDKLNLALTEFSSAEVQEFLRLLVKLNTNLHSTLKPDARADAAQTPDLAGAHAARVRHALNSEPIAATGDAQKNRLRTR